MSKKNFLTSPLIFLQGADDTKRLIDVSTNNGFEKVAPEIYKCLHYFRSPHSIEAAVLAGLDEDAIKLSIDNNLLLLESESDTKALWENHCWSRAAYLMFSQQDLEYGDYKKGDSLDLSLIEARRDLMSKYLEETPYPDRFTVEGSEKINLEFDGYVKFDPISVLNRRSVRGFSEESVDFSTFSSVLFEATIDIREAATSQTGDPFFLLNSFYAWTVIYVYVQSVAGIKPGLYFFDAVEKNLVFVHNDIDNGVVAKLIQGQTWISGGGFCLLIGAQWNRYAWIYRHSRAYINLIIQLGELSEEFIVSAYKRGLGGWLTPAVNESLANSVCRVSDDSNVDILHFMKFGIKKKI